MTIALLALALLALLALALGLRYRRICRLDAERRARRLRERDELTAPRRAH